MIGSLKKSNSDNTSVFWKLKKDAFSLHAGADTLSCWWVHFEKQSKTFVLSPVCVFMCSSKYCFMLKSLPHHWHMNCLCPMWMLIWERSWYLYWNRSSQFCSSTETTEAFRQHAHRVSTKKHLHICADTQTFFTCTSFYICQLGGNSFNLKCFLSMAGLQIFWDLIFRYTSVM